MTMFTRSAVTALGALVGAAMLGATAFAGGAHGGASVLIRHEMKGCHTWAVSGHAFAARQTLALRRGGTVTFTNNDVMPHVLVQLKGPVATIHSAKMNHMGAIATVSVPAKGVYVFTTKAGDDYMKGIKTVGPDNVLKLTVTVS
jgi:plastocyanin